MRLGREDVLVCMEVPQQAISVWSCLRIIRYICLYLFFSKVDFVISSISSCIPVRVGSHMK